MSVADFIDSRLYGDLRVAINTEWQFELHAYLGKVNIPSPLYGDERYITVDYPESTVDPRCWCKPGGPGSRGTCPLPPCAPPYDNCRRRPRVHVGEDYELVECTKSHRDPNRKCPNFCWSYRDIIPG